MYSGAVLARGATVKQRAVLRFLRDYIDKQGFSPSIRDVRDHFGFRGTNGVNDHLRALERRRFIERRSIKARSIVITERGHALLSGDMVPALPEAEDDINALRERVETLDMEVLIMREAISLLVHGLHDDAGRALQKIPVSTDPQPTKG